jgi:hypothetical protein
VRANPGDEFVVGRVACGELPNRYDSIRVADRKQCAVEFEERFQRCVTSPFVATDKWGIAHDTQGVERCELGDIRFSTIVMVVRPRERTLQQAGVA